MGKRDLTIKIGGDQKKFNEELKKSGKNVTKFDKNLKELGKKSAAIFAKTAVAMVAVSVAAFKLAKSADEFITVENSFKNLALSQGEDSQKMLQNMRELSVGTIEDLTLMKKANNALLLGLPVDRFGDMLKIARSSSKATGESMEFMLNSIVTGLGRGSKLMLDNLGIIVSADEANVKYAESLGKVASQLTDAERKQAFINLALEKGLDNVEKSGGANENFSDKVQKLTVSMKNLSVSIGKVLLPLFTKLADQGTKFADTITKQTDEAIKTTIGLAPAIEEQIASVDERIASFKETLASSEEIPYLGKLLYGDPEKIRETIAQLEADRVEFKEQLKEKVIEEEAEEQERKDALVESKKAKKRKELADIAAIEKKAAARRNFDFIKDVGKMKTFDELTNKERIANLQSTLGNISSLSTSHNKGLAAVGKASAISLATMNTWSAANVALNSAPPPFGAILMGATIAAGLANVAKIVGVQMATGGIIMPSQGGTQATIGEAGLPEAVIPLDSPDAEEFGIGGIGGGEKMQLDINFTGDLSQFIEEQQVENEKLNISIKRAS